jgi:hypothetical protein
MFRTHLIGKRQSEWLNYVPIVEFAINSIPNSSTGQAPFQMLYGYIPARSVEQSSLLRKPLQQNDPATRIADATKMIKRARMEQEKQYNKRRKQAHEYKEGDLVMIDTSLIRKSDAEHNISKKLSNRYQGPYPIKELLPKGAYRVHLPAHTKMHNSFNTSMLKPYKLTERGKYPARDDIPLRPQPVIPDEPDIFEIDRVLTHDFRGRGNDRLRFKILWKGYPEAEATYQKGHRLQEDSPESIQAYLQTLDADTRSNIERYIQQYV